MFSQSSQGSSKNFPQTLLEQTKQSPWFRQLVSKISYLQRLQTVFKQAVDWELAQQCWVQELTQNRLTVTVEKAALATRMIYNAPELVKILRQYPEFQSLKSIHCTVQPLNVTRPSTAPPIPIAKEGAQALTAVAMGIEDLALKNALLKLART